MQNPKKSKENKELRAQELNKVAGGGSYPLALAKCEGCGKLFSYEYDGRPRPKLCGNC